MVPITIVNGVYKQSYNWGAPHLVDVCFSLTPPCFRISHCFRYNKSPLNSDHTWNLFHAACKNHALMSTTVKSLEERQTTHINWHFWTHLFTSKISRKALGDGSRFCMSIQNLDEHDIAWLYQIIPDPSGTPENHNILSWSLSPYGI